MPADAATPTDRQGSIRDFLLGRAPPPEPDVLRAARLGPYAYTVLPTEHPARASLRGDYLASLSRHHRIIEELVPLLAAWNDAGVEPLLFKGFHLAEFIYPAPGARFHGDVDILVPEDSEGRALDVARDAGWAVLYDTIAGKKVHGHGVANLLGLADTQVDLHRSVVHTRLAVNRAPRRITSAVREASVRREWRGLSVRTPTVTDGLLILALQRCWWERGGLKAHDLPDTRLLAEREPGWRRSLEQRAAELGATRTVSLFLERCDPEAGVFAFGPLRAPPSRWARAVLPERPLLPFERFLLRAVLAPGLLFRDIPAVVPDLWRAWRAAASGASLVEVVGSVRRGETPAKPRSTTDLRRTVRAVRWAMKLWPGRDGTCLVRSLALYSGLRRRGWPVEFVSGVRRSEAGVTGHAWIELDGTVLPELNESQLVRLFEPNFRYPAAPVPDQPPDVAAALPGR